ncbi:TetR/AcrR family transcriptional regulator [Aestuariibius sp. HNIBRBA575]|uniref:TetR/AcrR family transcriptional regulator n=1 Tax=Aestuariibius sp. HNIBRBA575 TaxID=3233343 RepID=UPI0034A0F518
MTQSTATKSLNKADWISAGFRALAKGGPSAIKVEPIAREIGATKGSFYWHFKDLKALKSDMLAFWKSQATDAIIAGLDQIPPGHGRLSALIEAASYVSEEHGGYVAETAIRDWARFDTEAEVAVANVDANRIAFLEEELRLMGPNAAQKARLFYAAHIGLEQLAAAGGGSGREERLILLDLM